MGKMFNALPSSLVSFFIMILQLGLVGCSIMVILWRASRGASGCVVRRRSLGASLSCLGGFGSSPRSSPAARSWPAVRYFLDFPQSSPSLSAARSTASPTPEYSTTAFQVHRGGSNPLSPLFPSSRRRGSVFDQSRSCMSVCLPDRPFPSRNPAFRWQLRVLSGLPAS